eukprot:259731-Chlamydomonas_euryale.AAC.2
MHAAPLLAGGKEDAQQIWCGGKAAPLVVAVGVEGKPFRWWWRLGWVADGGDIAGQPAGVGGVCRDGGGWGGGDHASGAVRSAGAGGGCRGDGD